MEKPILIGSPDGACAAAWPANKAAAPSARQANKRDFKCRSILLSSQITSIFANILRGLIAPAPEAIAPVPAPQTRPNVVVEKSLHVNGGTGSATTATLIRAPTTCPAPPRSSKRGLMPKLSDMWVPTELDVAAEPPGLGPANDYRGPKPAVAQIITFCPVLKPEDLPDGEGWAVEHIKL